MNNKPTKTPPASPSTSQIRQDYKHREDCNPSLRYNPNRYTGLERRGRPDPISMKTIRLLQELARLTLVVLVAATLAGVVMHRVLAQTPTPQDGYDSLNMAPDGLYWSNPVQGYSQSVQDAYEGYYGPYNRPQTYFQPDRAPTYYNEYGQPTTVPDPRQYEDIEGVGM